ncbi:MAG TPA: hypothetical protein VGL89_10820 [Candidatus Koribacter sp.]|jgi:hypothetical protein
MLTPQKSLSTFRSIVGSAFSYERVEADPAVMYLLDPQSRIVYCNLAWNRFANDNDAPELVREKVIGTSVLDVTVDPLRGFYEHIYSQVKKAREPWEYNFECSSDEQYRMLRMRIFPLPKSFLLVENSVRVERPHTAVAVDTTEFCYTDSRGMVVMCAHCRRTRHPDTDRWDWVPRFVANLPPNTSHGLCKNCRSFYFGS